VYQSGAFITLQAATSSWYVRRHRVRGDGLVTLRDRTTTQLTEGQTITGQGCVRTVNATSASNRLPPAVTACSRVVHQPTVHDSLEKACATSPSSRKLKGDEKSEAQTFLP